MRILAIVFWFAIALSASADGVTTIKWVALPELELQEKCSALANKMVSSNARAWRQTNNGHKVFSGCFQSDGGICTIYTRKLDPTDAKLQSTIGHETLHCLIGLYHGAR